MPKTIDTSYVKGGDTMNIRELLLTQLTKEYRKLVSYGDELIALKEREFTEETESLFIEPIDMFDDVTQRVSDMNAAVLECGDDTDLLVASLEFVNHVSFIVASFKGKIIELEERLQWQE